MSMHGDPVSQVQEHYMRKLSEARQMIADLNGEIAALRAALTWAVEWMENYEGEVMPEWRAWQARGRAALQGAMSQ